MDQKKRTIIILEEEFEKIRKAIAEGERIARETGEELHVPEIPGPVAADVITEEWIDGKKVVTRRSFR